MEPNKSTTWPRKIDVCDVIQTDYTVPTSINPVSLRGEDKTWTRGPWTPTLDRVHGRPVMDRVHGQFF